MEIVSQPANVLFIIADQFRWDCLGAYGNPVIETPNLDRLAAEGASFDGCFVQTSPCGPSRMSIFTSRYLCSTRAVNNEVPLIDAHENLGQHMRDAGRAPAVMGYMDYAVDPRILPDEDARSHMPSMENFLPGWEVVYKHEYDSPEYFAYLRNKGYPPELCCHEAIYSPNVPPEGPGDRLAMRYPAHYKTEDSEGAYLTDRAREFVTERAGTGWVLSLNYIKPHPPHICSAPYNDYYDPDDMPAPNRTVAELESDHPYLRHVRTDPAYPEDAVLAQFRSVYYGMITELDAELGRLFETLRETGQWDDTLIVFTSDHGECLGDHYFTDKPHFYDETMRVPFIVRDPSPEADATRGQGLGGFVEAIDSAPTILEFLGVPIPDRFQGVSVLGRVRGEAVAPIKNEVHFEFDFRHFYRDDPSVDPDTCHLWVLRDERYKYVQFGREDLPAMLFDLQADPGEQHNLADDPAHAATALAYAQRMLRWRIRHEDQRMVHWLEERRSGK